MSSASEIHSFRHLAMNTEFTIYVTGESETYANGVCTEAFKDLDLLENELSRFKDSSDISRLNHLDAGEVIDISLATYDCLHLANELYRETGGVFDITIGPLFHIWRSPDGTELEPSEETIAATREAIGMDKLILQDGQLRAGVKTDDLHLDLGGIGKGYGLDQMAAHLREWHIPRALLDAGGSTLLALDPPRGQDGWNIGTGTANETPVQLANRAFSGSGFDVQGLHIIDPRTARPATLKKQNAWAFAPNAALADALSTAFILMGKKEIRELCNRHEGIEPHFP
ncbi:MAG: thiamine biosynthesis lipoprotein [Verrucomicrobiales bacterium]|jgi:thiamine biosynthesis lipoprotein